MTNNLSIIRSFNNLVAAYGSYIALAIFLISSLTDGLDGYFARKHNQITTLGIFLDPIADKIMVVSALLTLVWSNKINPWFVILIVAREFIVTGFRLVASDKKIVLSANIWGKIKTISQILLISATLIIGNHLIMHILATLTLLITIYSGWRYIYDNRTLLES